MNRKTIILISTALFFSSTLFAQGFANFKVEGALTQTLLKNNNKTASVIETIIDGTLDIKNLPVKYKLLSNCSVSESTPLNNDYTKSKQVTINKKDGSSKDWNIIVHQLVPGKLPLNIAFSKTNPCNTDFTNPKPWAGYGIDYSKPTVVRMGNDGIGFFVAYDSPAQEATFELTVVGGATFNGEFDVETSVDGKKWINLKTYKPGDFTGTEKLNLSLPSDARFVRWVYAAREKQNINLNNIYIK